MNTKYAPSQHFLSVVKWGATDTLYFRSDRPWVQARGWVKRCTTCSGSSCRTAGTSPPTDQRSSQARSTPRPAPATTKSSASMSASTRRGCTSWTWRPRYGCRLCSFKLHAKCSCVIATRPFTSKRHWTLCFVLDVFIKSQGNHWGFYLLRGENRIHHCADWSVSKQYSFKPTEPYFEF